MWHLATRFSKSPWEGHSHDLAYSICHIHRYVPNLHHSHWLSLWDLPGDFHSCDGKATAEGQSDRNSTMKPSWQCLGTWSGHPCSKPFIFILIILTQQRKLATLFQSGNRVTDLKWASARNEWGRKFWASSRHQGRVLLGWVRRGEIVRESIGKARVWK